MISRVYDRLENWLKPGKVVVIYGPRRVGKTTLLRQFMDRTKLSFRFAIGDELSTQEELSAQNITPLKNFVGDNELLIIDEAQRIPNIGLNLKIIVDNLPGVSVIATGSSSFDLAGQVGEPLVGRKNSLILYPLSQIELKNTVAAPSELDRQLPERLVFGSYPEVVTASSISGKEAMLKDIINSYLLKDILELERVKGAKILLDLLRLIAFQVGSQVSLSELSREVGIDLKTIARYLDLFEKTFILYNLRGYSRNLRSEINRKSKYYFYDNGVRNAIIGNFNALEKRNDQGPLWENFLATERLKKQTYTDILANNYFWRTWEKKEIDWIEEREGKVFGFEFKWNKNQRYKKPKQFLEAYPEGSIDIITPENYLNFVA